MSQMTRKSSIYRGRIGHYELKGYVQLRHNYEFASMAYGGTLGLSFRRGAELENVDMSRVQEAYRELADMNPLLKNYVNINRAESVVDYHVRENQQYVSLNNSWRDNILMPNKSVAPLAGIAALNELVVGYCHQIRVSWTNERFVYIFFYKWNRPLFNGSKKCL